MANTKKAQPQIDAKLQAQLDGCTSTAMKIRTLCSAGFSRGDISRILSIRYQWVRNVLITPLKNG
jgi:hypothetical protein